MGTFLSSFSSHASVSPLQNLSAKWRIQIKIFKPILKFRDLKCLGQNKMQFFVDLMGRRNVKFVAENFLPLLVENAIIGTFTWKPSLLNVFVVIKLSRTMQHMFFT